MTTAEIIQLARDNSRFTLFKEGLFYKCYNEDAMVFSQKVKTYKLTTKFVKIVDSRVISLGFPAKMVEQERLSLDAIAAKIKALQFSETGSQVVFRIQAALKEGFDEWKNALWQEQALESEQEANHQNDDRSIEALIAAFDLASNTPMQAMAFVQQLKNKLAN